ncbi:hypothetical protein KKHLCK_03995 [Candidatus Electrothrix laxa]
MMNPFGIPRPRGTDRIEPTVLTVGKDIDTNAVFILPHPNRPRQEYKSATDPPPQPE